MKRILPVMLLVCALLAGCGNQAKPTEPGTAATEQVLEETVDYSQLETTGPVTPETPTVPSQATAPTQSTTPAQAATTPTQTEPTTGPTPQPTEPVPPATDPDGYFNQIVRP